jgi:hypothetical protein
MANTPNKEDFDGLNDSLGESKNLVLDLLQAFKEVSKSTKDIKGDADISGYIKESNKALRDINKEYEKQGDLLKRVQSRAIGFSEIEKRRSTAESAASKLSLQIQTNANKIIQLKNDGYNRSAQALTKINKSLQEQLSTQEEIVTKADEAVTKFQEMSEKAIGPGGKLLKVMGENVKGLDKFTGDASKKMEEYAKHQLKTTGYANQLATSMVGVKALIGAAVTNMFSFQGIMTFLVKSFLHVDSALTDIQKNMEISREAAKEIEHSYVNISANSQYASVNNKRLAEAQQQLAEASGIVVSFGAEQLEQQTVLTTQMGLSADEAAKINNLSKLNNKSTQETKVGIADQVVSLYKQTGIRFSYKKIMQDVSKIEGQLALQYKNNPQLIAKAVIEAKKLGITLEQASNMGKNLLNWESSIEAELEAELLTNKQLNLEDARNLALKGKSAEAATEMLKQVGSAAEFSNMDAIQQEAIAKSMGMQTDELANSLIQQELLNKYGKEELDDKLSTVEGRKEIAALGGEDLVKAAEQQSAQDKMNDTMEKFHQILSAILGNSWALSAAMGIYVGRLIFAGVIQARNHAMNLAALKLQAALAKSAKTSEEKAIKRQAVKTAATAAESAAKTPLLGVGLAIAAGAAVFGSMMGLMSMMNDGVMAPDGKVLYSGKEGAIKLNDNDTVVAGTDLGGGKSGKSKSEGKSGAGGGTTDLSPLIAKVDQLISLLQKGSQVTLDGKAVGRALGLNSVNANMA